MDSIYSRKRIKIPKIKFFNFNNNFNKNKVRLLIIMIIAIFTFYIMISSIEPIFENSCKQKVISIATNIINTKSSEVLEQNDYNQMLTIQKGENGTNTLITNVAVINKIASDIAVAIENEFAELGNEEVEIPIGALTGNKYFAGMGPGIKIKIITSGNVETELKTEFDSQGINQTIYRIYLNINCSSKVLSSYKTIEQYITSQVLLVETVIVGEVPETYYNLDGMTGDDTLNLLE